MNQRLLKNGENINSQDITLFCLRHCVILAVNLKM